MVKTSWYYNRINSGDNPLYTSLKSSANKTEAYVGLSRVGELMNGGSTTADKRKITSWLLNTAGDRQWYTNYNGSSYFDSAEYEGRNIRPMIVLDRNVKIVSGDGVTPETAYTLSY